MPEGRPGDEAQVRVASDGHENASQDCVGAKTRLDGGLSEVFHYAAEPGVAGALLCVAQIERVVERGDRWPGDRGIPDPGGGMGGGGEQ